MSHLSSFCHFCHSLYLSFNNMFWKVFLCRMWPIHLAFFLFIFSRIFLFSLTVCSTCPLVTWPVRLISILLHHYIFIFSRYWTPKWKWNPVRPKLFISENLLADCYMYVQKYSVERKMFYRTVLMEFLLLVCLLIDTCILSVKRKYFHSSDWISC